MTLGLALAANAIAVLALVAALAWVMASARRLRPHTSTLDGGLDVAPSGARPDGGLPGHRVAEPHTSHGRGARRPAVAAAAR